MTILAGTPPEPRLSYKLCNFDSNKPMSPRSCTYEDNRPVSYRPIIQYRLYAQDWNELGLTKAIRWLTCCTAIKVYCVLLINASSVFSAHVQALPPIDYRRLFNERNTCELGLVDMSVLSDAWAHQKVLQRNCTRIFGRLDSCTVVNDSVDYYTPTSSDMPAWSNAMTVIKPRPQRVDLSLIYSLCLDHRHGRAWQPRLAYK